MRTMMITKTANQVAAGNTFEYEGWSYTATRVTNVGGIVSIETEESIYSMQFYPDSPVQMRITHTQEPRWFDGLDEYTMKEYNEAERRIAYLANRKDADDGKWRQLKARHGLTDKLYSREYKTEAGFLKAWTKALRNGDTILIAE